MDTYDSSILSTLAKKGSLPISQIAEMAGVSRITIARRIDKLVENDYLVRIGQGTRPTYELGVNRWWQVCGALNHIAGKGGEYEVWIRDIDPLLKNIPGNIVSIAQIGFTEIFNNAIDHSSATHVCLSIKIESGILQIAILDDGVGVFKKITEFLGLFDERLAILELSKGKLTTDKKNHSGIGIFVSSRMFDRFVIHSGSLAFTHDSDFHFDWLNETPYENGTSVLMEISLNSERTTQSVYNRYFDPEPTDEEFDAFHTTSFPVRLASLGQDLVSRSQGKWAVARLEQFKHVYLDFTGVQSVGQGFIDEVFRVFAIAHPKVRLTAINMSPSVEKTAKMFGRI